MLNQVQLIHACQSVIRQLSILVDKGYYLDKNEFFHGCEKEGFISLLKNKFKEEKLSFLYVDPSLGTFSSNISEYFEAAMSRHAKTVTMVNFGLRSNALLMGINVVLFIIDDVYLGSDQGS